MSKSVRKIISLLLSLSILLTLSISAGAELSSRVRTRIEGVGLMEGYEDGNFGEADELTRAQLCMIAARILQMESARAGESPYIDVDEAHWAKNVITTLTHAGVVSGVGDGRFMPDKSVSVYEAAKILVSVLGYSSFAEEMDGYPTGYLAQAGKLGLTKSISVREGAITRGEVAQMLYEALEVVPIGTGFMQNYPEPELTLYEILSGGQELVQLRGIVTETADISLNSAEPAMREGRILLGTTRLLCDMPMEDYLGCELVVYAYLDESTDLYKIKSFFVTDSTEITELDAEDVVWSGDEASFYNDEGREESLRVSSRVQTVFNGRLEAIPAEDRDIVYGSYTFIDNNEDGEADVLFIHEAQSFLIEKVNTATATVYFKNRATLNGRNAIVLDAEDEDTTISLTDTAGEAVTLEALTADMGITVFASKNQSYMKAIVSSDSVTGVVTEKSEEGIRIDDVLYELAKKPNGLAHFTPDVNDEASYALDCYGKLIDVIGTVKSSYSYAYVIDAKHGSGLASNLSLQTVTGLTPQKEVVVSAGEETISYYFQNDMIQVYDCATSFFLNGVRTTAAEVNPASLKQNLVAYRLNSAGEIQELHTVAASGSVAGAYAFNADILSFGGENVLRGYATDANTIFICVPESSDSDEDFYVQVKITDESAGNKVQGAVFFPDTAYEDPETEPVDILLIEAAMDASTVTPIQLDSDVCIVGEVRSVADEEGGLVYRLELLNGTTELNEMTKSASNAEKVAQTLRKGDLIRYVKDGFGRVVNISKLVSVQGLGNSYSSDVHINSGVESGIYGMAYHSVPTVYDYFSNQMVDRLQLTYDAGGTILSNTYRLFHEDMPTVYRYDRRGGWISPGSIEDIRTYNQVGDSADSVLAIIENNDIKALVIITDY